MLKLKMNKIQTDESIPHDFVNMTDEEKNQCLFSIIPRLSIKTIRWCIDNGANVHARDQNNSTLYVAIIFYKDDIARLLHNEGVQFTQKDIIDLCDFANEKGY